MAPRAEQQPASGELRLLAQARRGLGNVGLIARRRDAKHVAHRHARALTRPPLCESLA